MFCQIHVKKVWRTPWRTESNGGHLEDKSAQIRDQSRTFAKNDQNGGHFFALIPIRIKTGWNIQCFVCEMAKKRILQCFV